jgi:ABC-type thiamine transport system ATPase subunit
VVVREATFHVDGGECLALDGAGLGPLTLLRCVAGLVRPDRGGVEWRGEDGTPARAPAVALVSGDWRPAAAAFTVRDVLEQAVPAGRPQGEADRRIAAVLRGCALRPLAARRVAALDAVERWRVGVAGALVSGAPWLCLELPPGWEHPSREFPSAHDPTVRDALHAARRAGRTAIVVGPAADGCGAATRVLRWAGGGPRPAPGAAPMHDDEPASPRRVAEGRFAPPPLTLARGAR